MRAMRSQSEADRSSLKNSLIQKLLSNAQNGGKKIKFCGIRTQQDVLLMNRLLPDAVGMILNYPASFRSVSKKEAKALSGMMEKSMIKVGVFVDEKPEVIRQFVEENIIDVIQLHGKADFQLTETLKPYAPVIQAYVIKNEADILLANHSNADLVLLDAGKGSGTTFEWKLLEKVNRPYILAGGISPGNLEQALQTDCFMLDCSSGIETERKKDPIKARAMIGRIQKYNSLHHAQKGMQKHTGRMNREMYTDSIH